jgi:hypothetical protein
MPDMEPITREEKILSGEDLEPITRLEYFLKKASQGGGGGGSEQIMFIKAVKSNDKYLLPEDVDYDAIYDFIKNGDKLAVIVFEDYPMEDSPNYYVFYESYRNKGSSDLRRSEIYFAYIGNRIVLNKSTRDVGLFATCYCSITRRTREIDMWGNYDNLGLYLDYKYQLHGTLTAGQTTLTLTDNRISTDDMFDFYTSIFGVSPSNAVVTTGQLVLTFDVQQSDMDVKVRCW